MSPEENREGLKKLVLLNGRWPTAIEYAEAGLSLGGQCTCPNKGSCLFSGDPVTSDRHCYADMIRDRIMLEREGFVPECLGVG